MTMGKSCWHLTRSFWVSPVCPVRVQVEVVCGSMGNALGSVGGWCAGTSEVGGRCSAWSHLRCTHMSLPQTSFHPYQQCWLAVCSCQALTCACVRVLTYTHMGAQRHQCTRTRSEIHAHSQTLLCHLRYPAAGLLSAAALECQRARARKDVHSSVLPPWTPRAQAHTLTQTKRAGPRQKSLWPLCAGPTGLQSTRSATP